MNGALQQIKIDEGFSGKLYRCTEDKLTIGYGRNLEDNPLSEEEASFLLEYELKHKIIPQAVRLPYYSKLSPTRRAVIINMIYNLGIKGFKRFKRMNKALEVEDYAEASREMLASKWHSQVGKRAERLARQMRTNQTQM
jgi:lysozyme